MKAGSIEAFDPITPYINIDSIKCPENKDKFKVIENRVHSRAWHQERDRLKQLKFKAEDISSRAKVYANVHVSRWKAKVGIPE